MKHRLLGIVASWWALGMIATVGVAWVFGAVPKGWSVETSATVAEGDEVRSATVQRWRGVKRVTATRSLGLNWSPGRALGPPDTRQMGDIPTAWASLASDAGVEWLELDYDPPVDAVEIHVYENNAPGALFRLTIIDQVSGAEYEAWSGTDPATMDVPAGVFVARLPLATTHPVSRLRLYLDSVKVPGWNEIDAVGLVGRSGAVRWAVRARASSTYAANYSPTVGPGKTFAQLDRDMPAWSRLTRDEWASLAWTGTVEARGWPMVAVWGRADAQGHVNFPLRPVWPGLVVNSALFGLVLAGLYACTFTLRRFVRESRRLRRGCCMRCGYDLRFDLAGGCPECGWRRGGGGGSETGTGEHVGVGR